jgi:hypothetical protein
MTNLNKEDLLNNKQMAGFVNNGFIRLDEVIPLDLCSDVKTIFDSGDVRTQGSRGCLLEDKYPKDSPIYKMLHTPKVLGMIESLVGPSPRHDHHAVHKKPAKSDNQQMLHQDAEIDIRENAFDIQLSFFIHDTPKEMGGTRFLPGSHFRRVHESQIARYQNIKGMMQVECKAGTVVAWHQNLWHGAQPNFTDQMRYMFKVRLNPMVKQQRLWNTDNSDQNELNSTLFNCQPWYGQEERIEQFNRIRMWRYLTNNSNFDHGDWYTRIENDPE